MTAGSALAFVVGLVVGVILGGLYVAGRVAVAIGGATGRRR